MECRGKIAEAGRLPGYKMNKSGAAVAHVTDAAQEDGVATLDEADNSSTVMVRAISGHAVRGFSA